MSQFSRACGVLVLALALLLTGCGSAAAPEDRHPDWPERWFRVHPDLGVEAPEGFVFNESNDVMAMSGLYYATWIAGDGREITNPQGRAATVYDAQLYVLVKENETAAEAEADVADWLDREAGSYETGALQTLDAAGQTWQVLPLTAPRADNPYHHGAAAFAVWGSRAVSVELLCTEPWQGEAQAELEACLRGFHFADPAQQGQ